MNRFSDIDWTAVFIYSTIGVLIAFAIFLAVQPTEKYELQGVVVDKAYRPSETVTTYVTHCDDKGVCNIQPVYSTRSESYTLLLIVNDSVSSYSVSSDKYASTNIGDHIILACSKGKIVKFTYCGVE